MIALSVLSSDEETETETEIFGKTKKGKEPKDEKKRRYLDLDERSLWTQKLLDEAQDEEGQRRRFCECKG